MEQGEGAFANSLTDLMTSLMVIFILLLVAAANNAHTRTQDTRTQLIEQLRRALASGGPTGAARVKVEPDPADPLALLVIVPEQLLNFPFAQAALPPGGETFVKRFVPRMDGVVCSPRFRDKIGEIVIEGHTDPTGTDMYNIGLSQNRATSVAVASLQALPPGGERDCLESFLSVSGRGKAGAVSGTAAVMAAERQVRFKIRVRSAEERILNAVAGAH